VGAPEPQEPQRARHRPTDGAQCADEDAARAAAGGRFERRHRASVEFDRFPHFARSVTRETSKATQLQKKPAGVELPRQAGTLLKRRRTEARHETLSGDPNPNRRNDRRCRKSRTDR
jgi:hypothetical protein